MSQPPLSDADAEALASFVEQYICAIQYIPKNDTREPPGGHHGTGWLFDDGQPYIVTCEHVARWQKQGHLGYSCLDCENGISIEGKFVGESHPVDAAIATIRNTFGMLQHRGKCVTRSMFSEAHTPVPGELFYAYGFPGADSRQAFQTQIVHGTSVFLREVELDNAVYQEVPPHPSPELHICLAWSPDYAIPMLGTRGALSLPDGMSGSLLWNTRYEEITREGGKWCPTDARITGMIWGHSAKASQLYATPIEAILTRLIG